MTDRMENVLETVTIPEYPEIEQIKNIMIDKGAMNANDERQWTYSVWRV